MAVHVLRGVSEELWGRLHLWGSGRSCVLLQGLLVRDAAGPIMGMASRGGASSRRRRTGAEQAGTHVADSAWLGVWHVA